MAASYEELLAAAAVVIERDLAAYRQSADYDEFDYDTEMEIVTAGLNAVLADHNVLMPDESCDPQGQAEFQDGDWWSGYKLTIMWRDAFDASRMLTKMRQKEPEYIALDAFSPSSLNACIATLLLAEHQAADRQGGES